jgi:acyl-CoA dehydrogenase
LNDEQKKEYLIPTLNGERWGCFSLSEPGVGSDPRGIKTTAIRDGDDWIINGEKTWITSGNDADYTIVFARTSTDGMSAFVVDRAMGYKSQPIRMMAPHDPASLTFDNVRVPNRNLCGERDKGFEWAMNFIYRNRGWILPPKNLGAAERMLGMALEYAENRTTFGRKLIERENIMWMIAESELEIRAGKLLILNCAWQASRDMDYRHSACAVKYFTAQAANRIADRVVQIHGGMGLAKELPLERWYRDLRVERIYEGSDEMNLSSMIRNLRKGHASIGKIN